MEETEFSTNVVALPTGRACFSWRGLRVEQHAHQPKQVTKLVPCGMVRLQPGCQSCNICACRAARRSQTTIRPATTVSGNSFSSNYFSFLFSRTERTRFGWWELRVERHADQPKQMARLVSCEMVQSQLRYQSCNDLCLSCCMSIANDESASKNILREEFFFKKLFFLFLFSLTERTRFRWCGLRVDRHADQRKQVARLVPCGMVQLSSGCQ